MSEGQCSKDEAPFARGNGGYPLWHLKTRAGNGCIAGSWGALPFFWPLDAEEELLLRQQSEGLEPGPRK